LAAFSFKASFDSGFRRRVGNSVPINGSWLPALLPLWLPLLWLSRATEMRFNITISESKAMEVFK